MLGQKKQLIGFTYYISLVLLIVSIVVSCSTSGRTETVEQPTISRFDTICPPTAESFNNSVAFGTKVCSPDGSRYVQELKPHNQGLIGIFRIQSHDLLLKIDTGERDNDVKGLAWSPDNRWLAVMYHHGGGGYIAIVNATSGEFVDYISIDDWYHSIAFSDDGRSILTETALFPVNLPATSSSVLPPSSPKFQRGISFTAWSSDNYSTTVADQSLTNLAHDKPAEAVLKSYYSINTFLPLIKVDPTQTPTPTPSPIATPTPTVTPLPPPDCGRFPESKDGRYTAVTTGSNRDIHYKIIENQTGDVILTTHAEFTTPNDVKGGGFSDDSKKFAAAYYYAHAGTYTWIGVWSTETGAFLYEKRKAGWKTDLCGVFDE